MAGLFDGSSLERPVTCAVCGKRVTECACPKNATGKVCRPQDQAARIRREKRRGQWTTVIYQLDPKATDLKALLKTLKKKHAAGGKVTDDGVELQGDHRDAILVYLKSLGYPAKAAGG